MSRYRYIVVALIVVSALCAAWKYPASSFVDSEIRPSARIPEKTVTPIASIPAGIFNNSRLAFNVSNMLYFFNIKAIDVRVSVIIVVKSMGLRKSRPMLISIIFIYIMTASESTAQLSMSSFVERANERFMGLVSLDIFKMFFEFK